MAYVLGFFAADGTMIANNRGAHFIEFHSTDKQLLKQVVQEFPQIKIGAANIINSQELERCCESGVAFVSSPGLLPTLAQTATIYNMNYIPGIATISEGMQALVLNCSVVKILPANINLCQELSKYLPMLQLIPANINIQDATQFFNIQNVNTVNLCSHDLKSCLEDAGALG